MPTYTVTNSNFNLKTKQKKELAEGITKVHNIITGANTYFAQVIFNKTKKSQRGNEHKINCHNDRARESFAGHSKVTEHAQKMQNKSRKLRKVNDHRQI